MYIHFSFELSKNNIFWEQREKLGNINAGISHHIFIDIKLHILFIQRTLAWSSCWIYWYPFNIHCCCRGARKRTIGGTHNDSFSREIHLIKPTVSKRLCDIEKLRLNTYEVATFWKYILYTNSMPASPQKSCLAVKTHKVLALFSPVWSGTPTAG